MPCVHSTAKPQALLCDIKCILRHLQLPLWLTQAMQLAAIFILCGRTLYTWKGGSDCCPGQLSRLATCYSTASVTASAQSSASAHYSVLMEHHLASIWGTCTTTPYSVPVGCDAALYKQFWSDMHQLGKLQCRHSSTKQP